MPSRNTLPPLIASIVVAAIVWAIIAWPRTIEHEWQGPLKSASFAPFHDGQSPLEEIFPTPDEVESDMQLLQGVFEGIRTYTARGGMKVVPALADQYGFHLTHSAWLGRETDAKGKESNEREIEALIRAANRYPNAIDRVIVGNEVLLRQDLTPEQLIAYIDRVQAEVHQPVSYADVWAFWLKYPQVAEHVDFITIHILPYWEDEPVSVKEAHAHLLEHIAIIKERFPGKPILVGETGWPTQGRSRGPAAANRVNAAEYLRGLPALAAEHDFDYNVVEAFDQGWKARLEGTVGARWGIFDSSRQLKFGFSGKVAPMTDAGLRIGLSLALGLAFALFIAAPLAGFRQVLLVASACQFFSAALVYSVYNALQLAISPASFTWIQQHWLFYGAAKGWYSEATIKWAYELLLLGWVNLQAQIWAWVLAAFAVLFAGNLLLWLRAEVKGTTAGLSARFARSAYGVYGIGALVFAYMFSRAGRYMDVPLPHYLLPLAGALLLFLLGGMLNKPGLALFTRCNIFNRFAKVLLPLAALWCIWGEVSAMRNGQDFINQHPTLDLQIPLIAGSIAANHELLAWCLVCVLLALPLKQRTS